MSTFNGTGTMYYGWRHHPDGTAAATKWFVLFWLPVIPLSPHSMRVLTDFSQKEPFLKTEDRGFFAGTPVQRTEYQLLGTGRILAPEVLSTYFWTYVLGALLVFWPLWLALAGGAFLDKNPSFRQSTAVLVIAVLLSVLILVNPIAVVLIALRRARGFRGRLLE